MDGVLQKEVNTFKRTHGNSKIWTESFKSL